MDSNHDVSQPYTPTSPAEDLDNQAATMALEATIFESTVGAIHAYYMKMEHNKHVW